MLKQLCQGQMQFQYGDTILDIMPTKQPYIYILVICITLICIYIINHVFLCFTAVLMGWVKSGHYIHFG